MQPCLQAVAQEAVILVTAVQKTQKNGSKPSDVKPFGSKMTQAEYTEQLKQKKSLFKKSKKTECKK